MAQAPLRLLVLDFDLTVTVIHVYNTLSGGNSSLQLPGYPARSEVGQLARVTELEAHPDLSVQGGFALFCIGGRERFAALKRLLGDLCQANVELIICTRGLIGPCRKLLHLLGLLPMFSKVFGNSGTHYGANDFDVRCGTSPAPQDRQFYGAPDCSGWSSKRDVVQTLMHKRNLRPEEVLFVDDDPMECEAVKAVCPTIQVIPRSGMAQREMELLRQRLPRQPPPPPPMCQVGHHSDFDPMTPPRKESQDGCRGGRWQPPLPLPPPPPPLHGGCGPWTGPSSAPRFGGERAGHPHIVKEDGLRHYGGADNRPLAPGHASRKPHAGQEAYMDTDERNIGFGSGTGRLEDSRAESMLAFTMGSDWRRCGEHHCIQGEEKSQQSHPCCFQ